MAPPWRFLKHRNLAHRDAGGGAVHRIISGHSWGRWKMSALPRDSGHFPVPANIADSIGFNTALVAYL
jgi:hypothetical protein